MKKGQKREKHAYSESNSESSISSEAEVLRYQRKKKCTSLVHEALGDWSESSDGSDSSVLSEVSKSKGSEKNAASAAEVKKKAEALEKKKAKEAIWKKERLKHRRRRRLKKIRH